MMTKTMITPSDVPDWVIEVIQKLAEAEDISLEQASRQLMFQGALVYSDRWKRMSKGESSGA